MRHPVSIRTKVVPLFLSNDMKDSREKYPDKRHREEAKSSRGTGSADAAVRFITGNIASYIRSLPGVASSGPLIDSYPPRSVSDLDKWEIENAPFRLPDDVRNFYSVTDGLGLRWYASASRQQSRPLPADKDFPPEYTTADFIAGLISIRPLQEITRLNFESGSFGRECEAAHCAAFKIEDVEGYGTVAMVYGATDEFNRKAQRNHFREARKGRNSLCIKQKDSAAIQPTIWFRDRRCQWHPLTDTFTSYFRLAVVQLGIVGWQYSFTEDGLGADTELLMRRFAPERLVVDGMGCGEMRFSAGRC